MTQVILIRGPPASGKTTISKELRILLKNKYTKDVAYISEDNFRKELQFKYKAKDKICYENAFVLIKEVIVKLLELDSYDYVIMEGLFRYKSVLKQYLEFFEEIELEYFLFHFDCDLKILLQRDKERDLKSRDIVDVKKDIDCIKVKSEQILDCSDSVENICKSIISKINL